MSQAHKNRITSKKEQLAFKQERAALNTAVKDYETEQRTLRRYGASGKRFTNAYTSMSGDIVLSGPKSYAVASPVSKNVDKRHEARISSAYERAFDRKTRGTQSSAIRVPVK